MINLRERARSPRTIRQAVNLVPDELRTWKASVPLAKCAALLLVLAVFNVAASYIAFALFFWLLWTLGAGMVMLSLTSHHRARRNPSPDGAPGSAANWRRWWYKLKCRTGYCVYAGLWAWSVWIGLLLWPGLVALVAWPAWFALRDERREREQEKIPAHAVSGDTDDDRRYAVTMTRYWLDDGAAAMRLPHGSGIAHTRATAQALTYTVIVPPGATMRGVALDVVESAHRTRPGSARLGQDKRDASKWYITVMRTDPLRQTRTLPDPEPRRARDSITLGQFETGDLIGLRTHHILLVGMSDSGKSSGENVIVAQLAASSDVALFGTDLKSGTTLNPWRPAFNEVTAKPAEALTMLAGIEALRDARQDLLADRGRDKWDGRFGPFIVVVIDELAELYKHADPELIKAIMTKGRSAGVYVVAATQYPTLNNMGGDSTGRAQYGQKVCFALESPTQTRVVFGENATAEGWEPHALNTATQQGYAYVRSGEHRTPVLGRAYWLCPERVPGIAERFPAPALDDVSQTAYNSAFGRAVMAGPAEPEAIIALCSLGEATTRQVADEANITYKTAQGQLERCSYAQRTKDRGPWRLTD